MSLTYGFYNSLNHDRLYDATQMSSLFDGIIRDGIFESIGTQMMVKAGTGMTVLVGEGRAWFDHTWTLTDAEYPVTVPMSETVLERIDALVLEVNSEVDVRANSLKIVKGTPSSAPQKPELINTLSVHQHILAWIRVGAGVEEITQSDITNMVGTSDTPFITGILETMNVDALIAQWRSQFADQIAADHKAFVDQQDRDQTNFINWFNAKKEEYVELYGLTEEQCQALIDEITQKTQDALGRLDDEEIIFNEWFQNLKNQLDANQAAHLQKQIDDIIPLTEAEIDEIFD